MDGMIYLTTSGANSLFHAQMVHLNNLANINTTAFKADLVQLSSAPVRQIGSTARVYSQILPTQADFAPGALMQTGRDLDVAIEGPGWFAVQGKDGKEGYSRHGSLRINPERVLVTADDLPVLGEGGAILIPQARKIEIALDGTVSVIPVDSQNAMPVVLDRIKLVNPPLENLEKNEVGLIQTAHNQPAPLDASVRLVSGVLESSNVNAAHEMTHILSIARQFEVQLKMMEIARQNEEKATEILRV